jgi:hypothetical protein
MLVMEMSLRTIILGIVLLNIVDSLVTFLGLSYFGFSLGFILIKTLVVSGVFSIAAVLLWRQRIEVNSSAAVACGLVVLALYSSYIITSVML